MGIRESMSSKPFFVKLGVGALLLIATGAVILQSKGSEEEKSLIPSRAFFSIDDGKTFFADRADRIPPFDKDGHPAVQAYVFTVDGGRTHFVSYMQKYSDTQKLLIEKLIAAKANQDKITEARAGGILFKKPGGKQWVTESNAGDVLSFDIPADQMKNLKPVSP